MVAVAGAGGASGVGRGRWSLVGMGGGGGAGGGVGDVSNCWAICGLPDPCAKNPNLSSQHRDLSRLV